MRRACAPCELYGYALEVGAALAGEAEADEKGDILDALLALLPTAWASNLPLRAPGWTVGNPREGWIFDPQNWPPEGGEKRIQNKG